MIQQAIAIGGGGGSVEYYHPTTVAGGYGRTCTLYGVTSKPIGVLFAYIEYQAAIIFDSDGNEVVNFYGYAYQLYPITMTYDASTSTVTVSSTSADFQTNSPDAWYILREA